MANEAPPLPEIDDACVARYLTAHPDFFNRHAELLETLSIPHPTGQAVSLWERQREALREAQEQLRSRFESLIEHARRNEALLVRVHQLVLEVLGTRDPQTLFELLRARLAEEFHAERVTLLVFAPAGTASAGAESSFVGRDSARRTPFADLLTRGGALCGRLTQAQTQALFGATDAGGSHVVLPMRGAHWEGLLVISSDDATRFDPSSGTEYLSFLREVVVRVLGQWVDGP